MVETTKELKGNSKNQGQRLEASLLSSSERNLIRVRHTNLEKLSEVQYILVVGSSGSGKTTLVNNLRDRIAADPELSSLFEVLQRGDTRPERDGDNRIENKFFETLEKLKEWAKGGIVWARSLGTNRTEYYAFPKRDPKKIAILSGNNAFINDRESIISEDPDVLAHTLVVIVHSYDKNRQQQFNARSRDIVEGKQEETKVRMSDRAISMYPRAHVLVRNHRSIEDLRVGADLLLDAVKESQKYEKE